MATEFSGTLLALEHLTEFTYGNLGFRITGDACSKESTKLIVPIGDNNTEEVLSEIRQLKPKGESNWVHGVLAAINDFSDRDRFPEDVEKRLIVFLGTPDDCIGIEKGSELIHDALVGGSKNPVFIRFVGASLAPNDHLVLASTIAEFGGTVDNAITQEELEEDFVKVFTDGEPAIQIVTAPEYGDTENRNVSRLNSS